MLPFSRASTTLNLTWSQVSKILSFVFFLNYHHAHRHAMAIKVHPFKGLMLGMSGENFK